MKRAHFRIIVSTLPIAVSFIPLRLSAQASSPVAPRRDLVESVVREAYEKFRGDARGKNADYIPYLAQVDAKLFGVAIVTTDNQVLTLGDVNYSFSIQSISKVFTLALAMEELGPDKAFERIGSEPTGRAFNSVPAVVDMPTHTGNPLVNAGAIATTSLISGKDADEKWNKILAVSNTTKAPIEAILKDPQFSNVYFDISWDEVAKYLVATPESVKIAADLINRYPDRFLFGTDEVAPKGQEQYLRVYYQYDPLWRSLDAKAAEKVRRGNYERLFDGARERVRGWERTHGIAGTQN
jgi:Glutaminase